ncbi:hypothetical protein pb186bvf_008870 [Paramecium bursaria]
MNEQLLPKQSFDQLYLQSEKKLKLLRQCNDDAQRVDETKFEEIKETLREMRTKYEDWAKEEKLLLAAMDKIASGSDQKKKLKLSKDEFQKQNDRNKTIQENLINASYDRRRQSMRQSLGQAPTISQNTIRQSEQTYEPYIPEELVILDNQLIKERDDEIKQINQQAVKLQKLVNDIAVNVDQQDVQLGVIQDNQFKTKDNLVGANNELTQAQVEQKKAQRKYIWLLLLVILILAAIGVILYFTLR